MISRMGSFAALQRFRTEKGKVQEERRQEIEGEAYIISTFGENTEEWQEAKLNLEAKKEELSKQIGLSFCFGELWGNTEQFRRR